MVIIRFKQSFFYSSLGEMRSSFLFKGNELVAMSECELEEEVARALFLESLRKSVADDKMVFFLSC